MYSRKKILALGVNSFTVTLSQHVGNLSTELTTFLASENKITGGVPKVMSNLSKLIWIDLSNNLLTVTIPESDAKPHVV